MEAHGSRAKRDDQGPVNIARPVVELCIIIPSSFHHHSIIVPSSCHHRPRALGDDGMMMER